MHVWKNRCKIQVKHGGRGMLYLIMGSIPTALPKLSLAAFRYAMTVAYTERRGGYGFILSFDKRQAEMPG